MRQAVTKRAQAARESISMGKNGITNGTMTWKPCVIGIVATLERHDYTIHIMDVEASQEIAAAQIVQRRKIGRHAALDASLAGCTMTMADRRFPQPAAEGLFTEFRPGHGGKVLQ